MAKIHLLIGPVGAGKTTFGRRLQQQHNAVCLTLDEWMAVLFGDDERPAEGRIAWYMERTARCMAQIWPLTQQVLDSGTDVVLEIGLIQRAPRLDFYRQVDADGRKMSVYLIDADRDVRRARTQQRNEEMGPTYAMNVPIEVFELASNLWEPPDDDEMSVREVIVV